MYIWNFIHNLDWEKIVSITKDLIISISTIIVAIQGSKAFNQWRVEMKGKEKFRLFKQLALEINNFTENYIQYRTYNFPGKDQTLVDLLNVIKEKENYGLSPIKNSMAKILSLLSEIELLVDEDFLNNFSYLLNFGFELESSVRSTIFLYEKSTDDNRGFILDQIGKHNDIQIIIGQQGDKENTEITKKSTELKNILRENL